MSPLRGTCPEPPSPWGRLAFPRLSLLTLGSRKVPGTPVLRLPAARQAPPPRWEEQSAQPVPHTCCPAPWEHKDPKEKVGPTWQSVVPLSVHSAVPRRQTQGPEQAPAPCLPGLASCRPQTQHLAENLVNTGPCARSLQNVVTAVVAWCHGLRGGKVILSPAEMRN